MWRSLILLHFTCSLSLSLLNTHSLTDKYGGNYKHMILALQSVILSYLYGGFPAHWSPTSCALTGGSGSYPSDMTDEKPPVCHDTKASLLSGISARDRFKSRTSLKFVVLSAVFFFQTSDRVLIFNQQEHLRSSINLTRGTACPSGAVTHDVLEK